MQWRRVVTGHTPDGKAVVVGDEVLQGTAFPGGQSFPVWGRDDTASFPDDGSQPPLGGPFPPVGGCRFTLVRIDPGANEEFHAGVAEDHEDVADRDEPGMHRTASVDFVVVMQGEMGLELDDGVEVRLGPGCVVVQNGTRHRWHNRGDTPVVCAAVVLGARHDLVG